MNPHDLARELEAVFNRYPMVGGALSVAFLDGDFAQVVTIAVMPSVPSPLHAVSCRLAARLEMDLKAAIKEEV